MRSTRPVRSGIRDDEGAQVAAPGPAHSPSAFSSLPGHAWSWVSVISTHTTW
ncbi:hypothetical protein [Streptomyces poriticola]|uniref:hypothetical protein n=1 Tax=Streptomyces poriticola TaxID=3120506 RepID=UPI002FCE5082